MKKCEDINRILKEKINSLNKDFNILKASDRLLGEDVTERKKQELLNQIFLLQDIQGEVFELESRELQRTINEDMFKRDIEKGGR